MELISDEKLEMIGEIFACKTTRDMIFLLTQKEMYCSEIVKALGKRTSLIVHHLEKFKKLGIVIITQHKIINKRKAILHNFYRVDSDKLIELINAEIKANLSRRIIDPSK